MNKSILKCFIWAIALLLLESSLVYAHPGRTDSSGGHTCRTNCDSWGLEYGEYHYHNSGRSAPQPAPDTVIKAPKIEYKSITETEIIEFKTDAIDDSNLEKGKEEVRQEGENGIKQISYKITYTDGKETNKEKTGEVTTKEPKSKIIAKGAKETASTEVVASVEDNKSGNSWLIWLLVALGIVGLLANNNKTKNDQQKKK